MLSGHDLHRCHVDPNTSYCNRMSASQLCSAQAEHAGKVSKPIAPRNFCENKGLHTVQCRAGVDIRHHELAENYGFRELQGGRSTIDTTAGSMSAECADGDAGAAAILPAMVCQEGHISLLCESSSGLASHACPRTADLACVSSFSQLLIEFGCV